MQNQTKAQKTISARMITGIGILAAAAFVLQLIEISIPIMPSFIKLDLSDLPALIGAFAYGPVSGILIELLKNILHTMDSGSFAVGELSNFLLGAVFVGTAGFIYKKHRTKKNALIGAIIGAVAMAVMSLPFNYFIVYPVYYQFMPQETILAAYQVILPSVTSIFESLVIFNMPFTLVKGLLNVAITFVIYKRLSPILKGNNR